MKKVYYEIQYFVKKLKRILKWIPFLWNDMDIDGVYLYHVIKFKLERILESFEDRNIPFKASDSGHNIKYIKICINLLNNLIEDTYFHDMNSIFESKWGKSKFDFVLLDTEQFPKEMGMYELNITYGDTKNVEDMEYVKQDWNMLTAEYEKQKLKAKNLLFKILLEKIDYWWI